MWRLAVVLLLVPFRIEAQPAESPQKIGFRYDKTHVVVKVGEAGVSEVEGKPLADWLEKMPLADARVAGMVTIGTSEELMSRFEELFAGLEKGQLWTVEADGEHWFHATVETLAFAGTGCQRELNAVAILAIIPSNQEAFSALTTSAFLTWPPLPDELLLPSKVAILDPKAKLSPSQASVLRANMNSAMANQLAEKPAAKRTAAAERLLKGQGKLVYDAQRLRLGPAGEERVYVRANWMLGDFPAYTMTAYADPKHGMRLEGISGEMPELLNQSKPQFRNESQFSDELLGVFSGQNGWGTVLVGHHELDGYVVELLQYTPRGPERTDVAYGYGC